MTRPTSGQAYSVAIALVIAALLVPSLTHWRSPTGQRPLGFASPAAPTVQASPGDNASGGPGEPDGAPPANGGPGLGGFASPGSAPGPGSGRALPPSLTAPPGGRSLTPPKTSCPAIDASTQQLLTSLNKSLGVIPTQTIITALEVATGCSDANPALLAVGALQEIGDDLTHIVDEIGLGMLKLPAIHPVQIPAPVLSLFKPFAPALAPTCGAIGTASNIVILVAPHFPSAISGATSVALFQLAATCAQLEGNG